MSVKPEGLLVDIKTAKVFIYILYHESSICLSFPKPIADFSDIWH